MKNLLALLHNPVTRHKITSALSILLIFFLPILGWAPFLIIWGADLFISAKESNDKIIRIAYTVLLLIVFLLVIFNILMHFDMLKFFRN